ncbi:MAG TPA: hypothetical protein PLH23_09195 [Hyphomonadaceae bacterium]|nr:hypothetical protein [Hyphomonadaceae bacterium]HPI48431.1 hypothetical protein [Hyphomonadaceae bacterium]
MANAPTPVASSSTQAFPPQLMMWAGIYTVMFCIAGGMIAYLYKPDSRL